MLFYHGQIKNRNICAWYHLSYWFFHKVIEYLTEKQQNLLNNNLLTITKSYDGPQGKDAQ